MLTQCLISPTKSSLHL